MHCLEIDGILQVCCATLATQTLEAFFWRVRLGVRVVGIDGLGLGLGPGLGLGLVSVLLFSSSARCRCCGRLGLEDPASFSLEMQYSAGAAGPTQSFGTPSGSVGSVVATDEPRPEAYLAPKRARWVVGAGLGLG